jgi:hypothetical protein
MSHYLRRLRLGQAHLSSEFEFLRRAVFSNAMPLPTRTGKSAPLMIWLAAAAIIAVGAVRYFEQPSFWLDEAFVALSLRSPSIQTIFGPLEAGQLFPRVYLAIIALLREALGYRIWVLRLLPSTCFAIATLLWARLLVKRCGRSLPSALFAGALLLGSGFWLDQAIQLKQYTLDVLLALVPFLLGDDFFNHTLIEGKRRWRLAFIALPCLISYTYPLALGSRVLGWSLRTRQWQISKSAALMLIASLGVAFLALWFTDYRFNLLIRGSYSDYWSDCILGSSRNPANALRLLAKFFWGWHGRQPLVTAGVVPLQILGVYSVLKRLRTKDHADENDHWGSRSFGSILLLGGIVIASAIGAYPICAGRLTLFAQVHTQILAVEGALFALSWNKRKVAAFALCLFAGVVLFHSGRAYYRVAVSEPAENLRPLLPAINTEIANTIWVHPCSAAQVRSLPDPLPGEVVFGSDKLQPAGKTWVLWSHLGNENCVKSLEAVRLKARSWQMVSEGPGRGLALAEF